MTVFRISVRSLNGTPIHFKGVTSYEVIDGFVTFLDKYGRTNRFAVSNCEIHEESE